MSIWPWLRGLLGRPGARRVTYAPRRNGRADPGEVVWATVPFEDRPGESKDRPVLIVGRRDRSTVLGLQLSTQERRAHQDGWLPLGKGPWDRQGREKVRCRAPTSAPARPLPLATPNQGVKDVPGRHG